MSSALVLSSAKRSTKAYATAMINTFALSICLLSSLYFLALGGLALFAPQPARRFLLGFVGSASKHYAELAIRLVIGASFMVAAPRLQWPTVWLGFAWILLITTAVLLLIPWRWHRAFAERSVPQALAFLPWIGFASIGIGALIVACVYV
jgi:hypothetical protein